MFLRPRKHLAIAGAAIILMAGSNLGSATDLPEWQGRDRTWLNQSRATNPEDRYAMAGGCYAISSGGGYLVRNGETFAATVSGIEDAEPFRFQATDLGSYLLLDSADDFLAVSEGALGEAGYAATRSQPGAVAGGVVFEETDKAADEIARSEANRAAGRGGSIVAAPEASELADWVIDGPPGGPFTIELPATNQALNVDGGVLELTDEGTGSAFAFEGTEDCAEFPEIEINVSGPVQGGVTDFQEVRGLLEGHLHMMAFEFIGGRIRCGRPWHRFGAERALLDCPDHEPEGFGAVLEGILSNGSPDGRHNTDGWPTFEGWPKPGSLTHEQVYYKWLERAWRGGMRLFVNLLVDNGQLCRAYPYKRNSCNEMDGVRLQAKRIRELERYIDAQSGGPGEGWFRVVEDPFEAREIINTGKLAVVLGIEVSVPLDCGLTLDMPKCDTADVEEELDAVYNIGVRQMELVNKFDNAFSGVTGDGGSTGLVVNAGNVGETGSFWRMETCGGHPDDHEHAHDKQQTNITNDGPFPDEFTGRDSIFGAVLAVTGKSGAAPLYPEGPHCNVLGLSELGETMIAEMAERGMIFDPDHMSARARTQALDFIDNVDGEGLPHVHGQPYSGIISSHSWADDTIYERIYELGGVVTPHAGGSSGFVGKWEKHREWADDRFYFGFGYGSDVNGFSAQGEPRGAEAENPVMYPFTGFGGATIDQQHSGPRAGEELGHTYDINSDGVAHYGLYPDWLEDLRRQAGDDIIEDMVRGPEAYLQMWERAVGIAPDACRADVDDLTETDLEALTAGMSTTDVLKALGQPSQRAGTEFTYCTADGGRTTLTFTIDGRLIRPGGSTSPSPTPTPNPSVTESSDAGESPGPTAPPTATNGSSASPGGGSGNGGGGGGGGTGRSSAPPASQSPAGDPDAGEITTSVAASARKLRFGRRVRLSGEVTAPRDCAGLFMVDVEARTYGSNDFKVIDTVTTASDLSWRSKIRPRANASYIATPRTVGPCEGTSSTPTDVLVRVKISAKVPPRCKRAATVRGKVAPRRVGTKVKLQRRSRKGWKQVSASILDRRSRFTLRTDSCRGRFRIAWMGLDVRNLRSNLRFRLR